MRAIFLGKNKPFVARGLRLTLEKGIEVAAVVTTDPQVAVLPHENVQEPARKRNIPVLSDSDLYEALAGSPPSQQAAAAVENIDLVLSFIYWKRILPPLIRLPRIGCVNFHPAPLPEFRGWGVYNFAILEAVDTWAVSAHFVDASFDTGDLIQVNRFPIDPEKETAYSLARKCQPHLLQLLEQVLDIAATGDSLSREKQGAGRYFSRETTEQHRVILPTDSLDTVKRKIRAFWYPPYDGALIEVAGGQFTLVDSNILEHLG